MNSIIAAAIIPLTLSSCSPPPLLQQHGTPTTSKADLASEMRKVLDEEFALWYPRSVDTLYGGFFSDLDYKWELKGKQDKMVVTQARHVWSTANAAMFYQKDNTLRNVSDRGIRFLKGAMWDSESGGFYDLVNRQGTPIKKEGNATKSAMGNAFAVLGLAQYFRASGDSAALRFGQEAFRWIEKHSYDPLFGGYFAFTKKDGTPINRGSQTKTLSSTLHLFEAFTGLYVVWPDSVLQERILSLLQIVQNKMIVENGSLALSFSRDWSPVSYRDSSSAVIERHFDEDHISFGHELEAAYLMLSASEALRVKNDTLTARVVKGLVDHALENGWDGVNGGFFDRGYRYRNDGRTTVIKRTKEWWVQAEGLHSLLILAEIFPNDKHQYFDKFCLLWNYCKKYLIDGTHDGWHYSGTDVDPMNEHTPKGTIWKANYHTSRALINCINKLERATMPHTSVAFEPVNPNATPEARKLLNFLYSVSGKHIVAGQHNYVEHLDTYPDRVYELTGKYPLIWGNDFVDYYKQKNADTLLPAALRKHREGYIITLMWHVGRPQDDPPFGWKESIQAKMTQQEWNDLLTPGTFIHTRWLKYVDTIATYLKQLHDWNIPVLWRPYHEMNGIWFWWGNRKGELGSSRLFQMLYERYVHHHKLNNLIWVWNANAPRQLIDDEAYAYEDYFPGLAYVDVLAADVYHNDFRQSHHDELVRLGKGKPIALGEVGRAPTPEILDRQTRWTWFMIWGNQVNSHNTPSQIRDLYAYPRMITRGDLLPGR